MDLSQITAAHLSPDTQFAFDADALDRSILRAEARRQKLNRLAAKTVRHCKKLLEIVLRPLATAHHWSKTPTAFE